MSRTTNPLHRRSGRAGWLVPLVVFVIVAGLTAAVLAYFRFGPAANLFAERPAPTDSTAPVAVTIGPTSFHIPASYVLYASARKGGAMRSLDMIALLPDLQGYSLEAAQEFAASDAGSRVLNFRLRDEVRPPADQIRFEQDWLPRVTTADGSSAPHGLTRYEFRDDAGRAYRDKELFVGPTSGGLALLVCTREDAGVAAPSCEGDAQVAEDLALTYRFKRSQLEHWRDVDAGLRALTGAFMDVK
jgi:hypothetical protein